MTSGVDPDVPEPVERFAEQDLVAEEFNPSQGQVGTRFCGRVQNL